MAALLDLQRKLPLSWKRAILFDQAFVNKIETIFESAQKTWINEVLSPFGYNHDEVKSSQQFEAKREEDGQRYGNYTASTQISSLERVKWSAYLLDRSTITDLTSQALLSLPNVGRETVMRVGVATGFGERNIVMDFDNSGGSESCDVKIVANYQDAAHYMGEIRSALAVATRPWWLVRSGKTLWIAYGLFMIAIQLPSLLVRGNPKEGQLTLSEILQLTSICTIGVILFIAIVPFLNRLLRWTFPFIDFAF